jgi:hypothetical protein
MFYGHLRRLKVTCLGSLWDGTVLSRIAHAPYQGFCWPPVELEYIVLEWHFHRPCSLPVLLMAAIN